MELRTIAATARTESGKGAARRLRAAQRIPAVAYGEGQPARALAISPRAIQEVLATPQGRNTPLALEVEGGARHTVLLRDFQVHPVTREILHADFLHIHVDRPVQVTVPFELTGKPKGLLKGGVLHQVFRALPVVCLPANIPAKLKFDATDLDLDATVTPATLPLPEGVSVALPPTQTIAAVVSAAKQREEEPAAAQAPAAAAPAGAKAAPGKDQKPAAKAKK